MKTHFNKKKSKQLYFHDDRLASQNTKIEFNFYYFTKKQNMRCVN
jgi:hypothetical protein